jgi:hypothetical protein
LNLSSETPIFRNLLFKFNLYRYIVAPDVLSFLQNSTLPGGRTAWLEPWRLDPEKYEEVNLLYVPVTRAKLGLSVPSEVLLRALRDAPRGFRSAGRGHLSSCRRASSSSSCSCCCCCSSSCRALPFPAVRGVRRRRRRGVRRARDQTVVRLLPLPGGVSDRLHAPYWLSVWLSSNNVNAFRLQNNVRLCEEECRQPTLHSVGCRHLRRRPAPAPLHPPSCRARGRRVGGASSVSGSQPCPRRRRRTAGMRR